MVLLVFGDWWSSLTGVEQVFWGISIVFSVLFLIQFVVSLIGLDFDSDTDADLSGTDVHADGYHLDADFQLFSVRSIIAFFTFFGWAGVLTLNAGASTLGAVIAGGVAGSAAMLIVGYMMYMFSRLGQAGNTDASEALFNTGQVYLPIPSNKNGHGKIHITIEGTMREMDAITKGEALPTGSQIRVVEVLENNVLVVEPVKLLLPD